MGLINKVKVKNNAVDFAKDEIQNAVEDKVTEVVVDKTINYAMENVGSSFLPWWIMIMWWPIKQTVLLITWPIRIIFKK